MATCPNKNLKEWNILVKAQGIDYAYMLWDKYNGEVPEYYNTSLNEKLVNGFLKDFGVTVTEYEDLKKDIGVDSYTASDLIAKAIAYKKGQSLTSEVAYFAYSMLGITPSNETNKSVNSKLRTDLRFLIGKWDKFADRFEYHKNIIQKKQGFIDNKGQWISKVRDLVILDFLSEKLHDHYYNPTNFKKSLDTKWTRDDFTLWQKTINSLENFLNSFGFSTKNKTEQVFKLNNLGTAIADEILNKNYEYFDFNLPENVVQKYYQETIESDDFAKKLVEFGQKSLGLILTGSLALRRAGSVYRSILENLHDIDWVVPYDITNSENNKSLIDKIKEQNERFKLQGSDIREINLYTRQFVEDLDFYKKMKEQYPSIKLFNGFYGGEHQSFESYTAQAVINGEFYEEDGTREDEKSIYRKINGVTTKTSYTIVNKYKKGDLIPNTGYVVDFFIRLEPKQEEHENYFKLWKEIMIAKLKMNREKDLADWKAFVPFTKSKDSFNFNYEGFRHFGYENSPINAFEEIDAEEIRKNKLNPAYDPKNKPSCPF